MQISEKKIAHLALQSCSVHIIPTSLLWSSSRQKQKRRARSHGNMHTKARGPAYPGCNVKKFEVPDKSVKWSTMYKEYKPIEYTSEHVLNKPSWADPDVSHCKADPPFQYNSKDCHYNVDRTSFTGEYEIIEYRPRNPIGRTGMTGRGLLGRWGPNHAADPIVTRWKVNSDGKHVQENGKPILEFVAIKRNDNGQWAIPGGMVEPGDTVSKTLKKEFGEEAFNSIELSQHEQQELQEALTKLFQNGSMISCGYVDDPRNTDNAWIETVAMNFHDEHGKVLQNFQLKAGDDAGDVKWMEVRADCDLYANHRDFLKKTARFHCSFW
ncbi:ADP-ribose pyrophosphatase, mitochondrial-like [Xenia sp. Carnegie-2017]|uniref:ADP-ribose pyrophosphatase, mitochondrial-like n=1 Tax=Xenia sp. Carnegie-2017 TaxID=2897299 RepID=UPI001F04C210|nr:ADP-ribose pyrophosphatase, mitochondrial-like [Xenia sp. Carnegie-2017]